MGKLKKDKRKINTYSKKGHSKPESINVNVINNITKNCIINVTNNYYFFPSKSSSGDEFDQLLKGPIYNVPKESSHSGFSGGGNKFFMRQDTFSLYNSDATPNSISSVHLFKDGFGDSPDIYSPIDLPTPPTYRKEKNKLVLKTCGSKNKNRVFKKKTKRMIKCKAPPVDKVLTVTATSSTPNHALYSQKKDWTDPNFSHISPIVPFQKPFSNTLDSSIQDLFAPQENDEEEHVSPKQIPNVSDLINCFGNLELTRAPKDIKGSEIEPRSKKEELSEKSPCKLNSSDIFKEVFHDEEKPKSIEKEQCDKAISPSSKQRLSCDIILCQSLLKSPSKVSNMSQVCKEETINEDRFLNIIRRSKNRTTSLLSKRSRIPVIEQVKPRSLKNENYFLIHDEKILNHDSPKIKHHAQLSNAPKITESKNNCSLEDIIKVRPTLKITAGSKWRKSFIQQKQSDPFRSTIQPDVLVMLLKDSENLSCTSIQSRYSCNLTTASITQLTDHFIRRKTDGNIVLPPSMNSSGFNNTLGILKRITKRKKQIENYNLKIENIIEESLSQENAHCSADEKNTSKVETKLSAITEKVFEEKEDNNEISCSSVETPKIEYNKTMLSEFTNDVKISTSETDEPTPPILKMDPKSLLNTITKRKKVYLSPEPCQNLDSSQGTQADVSFSDREELSGLDNLENELDQSGSSMFEGKNEEELSNIIENDIQEFNHLAEVGFLLRCGLEKPVPFSEAFPDSLLANCRKIGEGVYGEVFMLQRSPEHKSVLKIIPVEGDQQINGATQKHFEEVLSELVISEELSLLRTNSQFGTSGFCELKNKYCLQGQYPPTLIELWHSFKETSKSDNDCPDVFGPDQLYMAVELGHGGECVESYRFSTSKEAYSVFLQTTFSLAVAESGLEFEHRDLHIGNVLVRPTDEEYVSLIQNGFSFQVPTYGVKATIIDFTLSRMSFKDRVLFFDMAKDPDLFTAEGDYQFEVYRIMRNEVNNNWSLHAPVTNIRWLYYLIDKLITQGKFRKKKTKMHSEYLKKLKDMKSKVLDFMSSTDLAEFLLTTFLETIQIIKTE